MFEYIGKKTLNTSTLIHILCINYLLRTVIDSYETLESFTFETFGVLPQNLNDLPTLLELLKELLKLLEPIGTNINEVLGLIDHRLDGVMIQSID